MTANLETASPLHTRHPQPFGRGANRCGGGFDQPLGVTLGFAEGGPVVVGEHLDGVPAPSAFAALCAHFALPAERGPVESQAEAKRAVSAAMRTVGERLGNTLPWPVPRTSVRPWSSSTWTGERSLISCALSAPGTWGWT